MSKKEWLIIAAVVLVGGAGIGTYIYKNGGDKQSMDQSKMPVPQSHATYSLKLTSGNSYPAAKPATLNLEIKDNNDKIFNDFDVVHEKKLHLIVVRKDRTNFQHVHPVLDELNGSFKLDSFAFPADGEYRVYADFTPSNSQTGPDGRKMPATPFQDVQAGDTSKYTPQPIGADKLNSSTNGFDTAAFFPAGDDSPGAKPVTDFYAGQDSTVAIEINKNGKSYTSLQKYLGALGHMVVLGPKLEYIHAHAQTEDVASQGGLVVFSVKFPEVGQYKLYLQTQADDQVNTTDYTITAKPNPGGNQDNQPTPGMGHSGH